MFDVLGAGNTRDALSSCGVGSTGGNRTVIGWDFTDSVPVCEWSYVQCIPLPVFNSMIQENAANQNAGRAVLEVEQPDQLVIQGLNFSGIADAAGGLLAQSSIKPCVVKPGAVQ